MEFNKLNNIKSIEHLLLECRDKRFDNICKEIEVLDETFIKAILISNDFQKPIIDPYFIYISMLPIDIIPIDSILSFQINDNKLIVNLYTDNNDYITGIKVNFDILKRMSIIAKKLNRLPDNLNYINDYLKKKLDKLRYKKDDWEFLQILDCIEKTNDIFKNMIQHISKKKVNNENILEALYYENIIQGNYTIPYLPIFATKENASHIHYFNNNSQILKNSVILMDCGVKNKYGYCSDITRTVIDEKSILQKKVYTIVKKAQDSCLQIINEYLKLNKNISLDLIDEQCIKTFIEEFGKFDLDERYLEWSNGIMNCKMNSFSKALNFIKKFYTHFIGHNIGLETHDPNTNLYLEESCIFTIEPGLYFNKNSIGFNIPIEYYDIGGIRIEDIYAIKNISGNLSLVHLSSHIPK